MGSLRRMPSGNLYEGFPCVRVGDYLLPSSMDLRAPPNLIVLADVPDSKALSIQ